LNGIELIGHEVILEGRFFVTSRGRKAVITGYNKSYPLLAYKTDLGLFFTTDPNDGWYGRVIQPVKLEWE
jgi:hypothetical protein